MVKPHIVLILGLSLAAPLPSAAALADDSSVHAQPSALQTPVGRWKTIDDATGKAKSIVLIWEERGELFGRIEKLLAAPPDEPEPKCTRCDGALKDKPLVGMRILWGLKRDGDEWSGGRVLDPDNGKTYRCTVALKDDGKTLKLRGYIGFSLLGRTQYWKRVE